jgi:hypothetical protein
VEEVVGKTVIIIDQQEQFSPNVQWPPRNLALDAIFQQSDGK